VRAVEIGLESLQHGGPPLGVPRAAYALEAPTEMVAVHDEQVIQPLAQ
jgi:hypothetical protein